MADYEHYDIRFTRIAEIGRTGSTCKALTVVGGDTPWTKLDLRVWRDKDGEQVPGNGLTLDLKEGRELMNALESLYLVNRQQQE